MWEESCVAIRRYMQTYHDEQLSLDFTTVAKNDWIGAKIFHQSYCCHRMWHIQNRGETHLNTLKAGEKFQTRSLYRDKGSMPQGYSNCSLFQIGHHLHEDWIHLEFILFYFIVINFYSICVSVAVLVYLIRSLLEQIRMCHWQRQHCI